jgi:hypothetical protein
MESFVYTSHLLGVDLPLSPFIRSEQVRLQERNLLNNVHSIQTSLWTMRKV